MKKIIALLSLMLCMFATAQENATGEYMYIFHSDNRIERVEVAKIDSVTFVDPYQAVDLGLPSGIKWASFNVGARAPWEYGDYYAWGETEEKEDYSWETYKWCNGTSTSMTKYCTNSDYGTVDNKSVLDPEDDVATVKWGGDWRMPTEAEQAELRNNCDWEWTEVDGVAGYNVKSRVNGNSIFLPAAGYCRDADVKSKGDVGYYWSSSLDGSNSSYAFCLGFDENDNGRYGYYRFYGRTVRPVCGAPAAPVLNYTVSVLGNENGTVLINGENVASASLANGTEVTVVATANDGYEFAGWFIGDSDTAVSTDAVYTFTVEENVSLVAKFERRKTFKDGYEYVDLGLPSGLKWATFNVGATKPEEYGGYYAWGETEEKEDYSWETYKWCNGTSTSMTKYCTGKWFGTIDHKTVLDLEDDIAHVKWGGDWRMPTTEEQRELLNNCTWTRATQNGVNGYKVTGPNGNSIFLPAAGYRYGTDVYNRGDYGYFWSSSAQGYYSYSALGLSFGDGDYDLSFGDGDCGLSSYDRCYGQSVRPVIE